MNIALSQYISIFSKRRTKTFLVFLVFLYFIFHLLQGERGYIKLQELELKQISIEKQYEQVHKERLILEQRVNLLNAQSLNKDMLDEQVRRVLGYTNEKDIIVLID